MHKLIDCLVRRLHNINQPLVRLDHEVFPAVAVYKRTPRHVKMLSVCGERHRSHDPGARPHGGVQYFLTAVVYNPTVIRF